jgi:hypothetical protein
MFDKRQTPRPVRPPLAGRCLARACCLALLAFMALPPVSRAQQGTPPQQQSRLEQYEATYQANLRTLHAPLFQDYLRMLESLKVSYTSRNRLSDVRLVDAEIARMKSIMATTGVFPSTELQAALAAGPDAAAPAPATPQPAPATSPSAKSASPALPTLLAAEARGLAVDGKTGAVPLGSAEWQINKMPAGTFDLFMVFASDSLVLPEQVTVNLGGHDFKGAVGTDRATGSPETFRLLRLCQVTLDTEVSNVPLTLTAATKSKPVLWVKRIFFALPKKPVARTPATP